MATPLPKVNEEDTIANTVNLFSSLNSLIGTGKSTTNKAESVDPAASAQADALISKIFGDNSPENIDAVVGNILERAKQAFAPAQIMPNAAGVRAYSDSSYRSMKNEAMARATGEAAAAKLNAMNSANKQASDLVEAKLKGSRTTVQQSKTSASPAGKGLAALGVGSFGYNILKKSGILDKKQPDEFDPENMDESDYDALFGNSDSFSAPVASGVGDAGVASSNIIGDDTSAIEGLIGIDSANELVGGGAADTLTQGAAGAGEVATTGITGADVVTPLPMPPATKIDPETGLPIPQMPPAQAPQEAGDIDAADVLPADEGGEIGTEIGTETSGEVGGEIAGETAGEAAGSAFFPGLFTIANIATGGELASATYTLGDTASSAIQDLPDNAMDITNDITDAISTPFQDISESIGGGGKVICTEAVRQGLMDSRLYYREVYHNVVIRNLSENLFLGYQFLACPVVLKMRKDKEYAKFWASLATTYCNQVLGDKKTILGWVLKNLGEPFCQLVGYLFVPKEFDYLKELS